MKRYKEIVNIDEFPYRRKTYVTTKMEDRMIIKLIEKHPTYICGKPENVVKKGSEYNPTYDTTAFEFCRLGMQKHGTETVLETGGH